MDQVTAFCTASSSAPWPMDSQPPAAADGDSVAMPSPCTIAIHESMSHDSPSILKASCVVAPWCCAWWLMADDGQSWSTSTGWQSLTTNNVYPEIKEGVRGHGGTLSWGTQLNSLFQSVRWNWNWKMVNNSINHQETNSTGRGPTRKTII